MNKQQMIKRIKAVTGSFRQSSGGATVVEDKATKLARSFKGKMGGVGSAQELAMATLLTESSGVDVLSAYNALPNPSNSYVKAPEDKYIQPLVCVVCTSDPRNSGVAINIPVVCLTSFSLTGNAWFLNSNGTYNGKHINRSSNDSITSPFLRLATDEEIERLTEAQLNKLIEMYSA